MLDNGYVDVYTGLNDEVYLNIQKFYTESDIKIDNFVMPSLGDIESIKSELLRYMGRNSRLEEDVITRHLDNYLYGYSNKIRTLSNTILNGLREIAPSESGVTSSYIKLAFWLKTMFSGLLRDNCNNNSCKIYISTRVKKYEAQLLHILALLGNEVVVIDDSFDSRIVISYNTYKVYSITNDNTLEMKANVCVSFNDVIEIINGKALKSGGAILVIGEDYPGKLNNALVNINNILPNNVFLMKQGIDKPTYNELSAIPRHSGSKTIEELLGIITKSLFIEDKDGLRDKAIKFLKKQVSEYKDNPNKAYVKISTFACLYNRYDLKYQIYIIYGDSGNNNSWFISFLSSIGKTVVIVDSAGLSEERALKNGWTTVILDKTVEYHAYPISTTGSSIAFNAREEINSLLYNGQTEGLYRVRQYNTCCAQGIKTTFDEVRLYWDKETVYRPEFKSYANDVLVPVFYDVAIGHNPDYNSIIKSLITDHTIVCYGIRDLDNLLCDSMRVRSSVCINADIVEQRKIYNENKISISAIKGYSNFTYKHLDEGVQRHILSKTDEFIREDWVINSGLSKSNFIDIVLNVALNFGRQIQQYAQWYDYTKVPPKLILIHQGIESLTLNQSIILGLLHLMGWDILIFVPTCYNVLGKYINQIHMNSHVIGQANFDTNIQSMDDLVVKPEGFFNKFWNNIRGK